MGRSKRRRVTTCVGVALGLAFGAAAVPSAWARSVDVEVAVAQPTLLAGGTRTTHLWVGLTGSAASGDQRAPLNVAVVLDRSGSMRGRKIAEAKRAAALAIGRLRDDDIVSVVAYQSTVDVLVPATKLRDRRHVLEAIGRLEAGGQTALFGGVSKGAQELSKFLDDNRVNTLVLLSDGLANVGPRSPGELAQLGTSLARQGMAVTTIGLGLDYNEDLMTRLAMASDGNHFFVEDAADLEYAFATEFGDALSAMAQGVELHIRCPEGVRPVRVLGRDAEITGRDVHATMNQIFRDQTRYLLLELEVAPGLSGTSRPLAEVDVRYHDLLRGSPARAREVASVAFTSSAAVVEARTNPEVMVEVVRQIGTERNELAMALRDAGKIEEARRAYLDNSSYLADNAKRLGDETLEQEAQANVDASENLQQGRWKQERKKQRELQLRAVQQRAAPPQPTKEPEKEREQSRRRPQRRD